MENPLTEIPIALYLAVDERGYVGGAPIVPQSGKLVGADGSVREISPGCAPMEVALDNGRRLVLCASKGENGCITLNPAILALVERQAEEGDAYRMALMKRIWEGQLALAS